MQPNLSNLENPEKSDKNPESSLADYPRNHRRLYHSIVLSRR